MGSRCFVYGQPESAEGPLPSKEGLWGTLAFLADEQGFVVFEMEISGSADQAYSQVSHLCPVLEPHRVRLARPTAPHSVLPVKITVKAAPCGRVAKVIGASVAP